MQQPREKRTEEASALRTGFGPTPLRDESVRTGYGRAAGVLALSGALCSLPFLLLDHPDSVLGWVFAVSGLVGGLASFRWSWDGMPSWLIWVIPVLASLEITIGSILVSPLFTFYFVFVAGFAALMFSRTLALAHVGLILAGTLVVALDSDTSASTASLVAPMVLVTVAITMYVRERLEENQTILVEFAQETKRISERLTRGEPTGKTER